MFNLFKKDEPEKKNNLSLIAVTSLLIHSAKIDEIIEESEKREKDSNQILDFTREIKNINEDKKKLIIEALWNIIYSDQNADMYETNLMRRLSGLLYLDNKVVGDIKKKIIKKNNDISS